MKEITVDELHESLDLGNFTGIVLDVRGESERRFGTVRADDDVVIPLGELGSRYLELDGFKEKEIVVYCRSGGRSMQACLFLEQQGFSTTNLVGGILAWKKFDDSVILY